MISCNQSFEGFKMFNSKWNKNISYMKSAYLYVRVSTDEQKEKVTPYRSRRTGY